VYTIRKQDEEISQCFHEVCDKEYLTIITACDDVLKKIEEIGEVLKQWADY